MKRLGLALTSAGLLLVAGPALAHPGHGPQAGLLAGFAHPFTGLDHLLGMTAVGLWAGATHERRALWLWPLAFLACMWAGFGLGRTQGSPPELAWAISASVVALGLVLAFEVKPAAALGAGVAALFGLAHGYAHGKDLPAGAGAIEFTAGFSLATLILLALGLVLSRSLQGRPARVAGLAVAFAGAAMLLIT